jgi:hypothetical protein
MASYLAGPWAVRSDSHGTYVITERDCLPVAEVHGQLEADHKATARLIASAPALADQVRRDSERLRRVADYFRLCAFNDRAGNCDAYAAEAEATLAAAVGEGTDA